MLNKQSLFDLKWNAHLTYHDLHKAAFMIQKKQNPMTKAKSIANTRPVQEVMIKAKTYLFKGEWNSQTNLPHGHGIVVLQNGDIFEGTFFNGLPKGTGRLISGLHKVVFKADFTNSFEPNMDMLELEFPDRSRFKGKLKENQMEGYLVLPNKETLIGVFDKFSAEWNEKVIKIYQNG